MNELTVGSLFSGIGGLELGLERTGGFKTIWNCEIDPYASVVLKKHWPDVPNLGDITKVEWGTVEKPDLICGGFPCQDISVAGKGKGIKEGTRSGLWFRFAEAIRALRPRYVLAENVPMLANRGLDIVLCSLAEIGYDAEWFNLSAADVGAWHRRERIFIIAHSVRGGCDGGECDRNWGHLPPDEERDMEKASERQQSKRLTSIGKVGDVPDTERNGWQHTREARNWRAGLENHYKRNNGGIWKTEPAVGRVAHGVPNRVDRIKCLGNAVVPQVAEAVGEYILAGYKEGSG